MTFPNLSHCRTGAADKSFLRQALLRTRLSQSTAQGNHLCHDLRFDLQYDLRMGGLKLCVKMFHACCFMPFLFSV